MFRYVGYLPKPRSYCVLRLGVYLFYFFPSILLMACASSGLEEEEQSEDEDSGPPLFQFLSLMHLQHQTYRPLKNPSAYTLKAQRSCGSLF